MKSDGVGQWADKTSIKDLDEYEEKKNGIGGWVDASGRRGWGFAGRREQKAWGERVQSRKRSQALETQRQQQQQQPLLIRCRTKTFPGILYPSPMRGAHRTRI